MGRLFYNPLISKSVDSDDQEFGLKSLDDVDLDRSFSPDEVDFTRQTIQNGLPEIDPETLNKIRELQKQNRNELNPFEFNQTAKAIQNGTLDDSMAKQQAVGRMRQKYQNDQQEPNDMKIEEDQKPLDNDKENPWANRPSMKPIWNKRVNNK